MNEIKASIRIDSKSFFMFFKFQKKVRAAQEEEVTSAKALLTLKV